VGLLNSTLALDSYPLALIGKGGQKLKIIYLGLVNYVNFHHEISSEGQEQEKAFKGLPGYQ